MSAAAGPPRRLRLVVLTYESLQANLITARILATYPGQVVGILHSTTAIAGLSRLGALRFLLTRTGLGFSLAKGLEIAVSRAAAARRVADADAARPASLAALAAAAAVPLRGAADVQAAAPLATLRAWQPDLLISVHLNQRLRAEALALAPLGALNVHGSPLPRYRGLFPYFWMLANGEREAGVTVHWMTPRLDAGDIVLQERFVIAADETVFSLSLRGAALGAALITRAIAAVQRGDAPRLPQDERLATYHSWPQPTDLARLRARGRRFGSPRQLWRGLRQEGPTEVPHEVRQPPARGAWRRFYDGLESDPPWHDHEAADYCTRLADLLPLDGSQRVLDFGCGSGLIAARLAPRTAEYLFWDAAPRLRARAAARLAAHPQARLLDLEGPLPPAPRVDAILINSVLQYLDADELRAWLPRWHALLRPGGRIIASDLIVAPEPFVAALAETLRFAVTQRLPLRGLAAGLVEMRRYAAVRSSAPLTILPLERLGAWALEAGLTLQVAAANLTFRTGRCCVVLTRE